MLALRDWHAQRAATFTSVNGAEVVRSYNDIAVEYAFLSESTALLDLSFRGRLCLLGADRLKFLHGQVTNDVNRLAIGDGCYAALVNSKAKMESDLWTYRLQDDLLLDFEPGLTEKISARLDKYIIADDVQVVDVAPHYGLLSFQGPKATEFATGTGADLPSAPGLISKWNSPFGDAYVANRARYGTTGYDFYIPSDQLLPAMETFSNLVSKMGGGLSGWTASETVRIENGIPRFGADMDETNLPPETGLDKSAISYSKGCYIGQEIIARIRTYGQPAKKLKKLRIVNLPEGEGEKLVKGIKLVLHGKDVGYITSAAFSPREKLMAGLGYVRREVAPETILGIEGLPGAQVKFAPV